MIDDDNHAGTDGDADADDDNDEGVLEGEIVEFDEMDNEYDEGDLGDSASAAGEGDGYSHVQLIKRDPLSAYVQETKRFRLLDREEEHDLAVRFLEQGDTAAARRLIEANLRLVVKIAYDYRRAHRNLLDLIQEGNIGLMLAVQKYDPYRGIKLSSYAAWWIRAYILKFILNNWRMVKIGTTQAQRKLFFNLRKERERLEQLGFTPTAALLAENLEVSEQEVVEMEKRMAAPDASLDAPMGGEEDGLVRTRMDYLQASDEGHPDVQAEQKEFRDMLRGKLEEFGRDLDGREATIFTERLLSESPLTLQQIGEKYDISRERARQLEKRLIKRLRKYLERELGTEVDIGAMMNE